MENREKDQILFQDMAENWLKMKKASVKESTYACYFTMLHLYILPALGACFLCDIDSEKIEEFLLNLKERGRLRDGGPLSDKTVRDCKTLLRQILHRAKAQHLIREVPDCPLVPVRQPAVTVFTKSEQTKIEQTLLREDTPFALGVFLSLYGGLRIGEVCGIMWDDFDWINQAVRVRRAVSRIAQTDPTKPGRTRIILSTPKTACSVRMVPLPSPVFLYFARRRGPDGTFLTTGTEKFMEPRVARQRFRRLLGRAGVPPRSFHSLRHTYATRCVEQGVDIKSLSENLGHSNVQITLQRYVHPSFDIRKEEINKLPSFVDSSQNNGQITA